MKILVCFGTRPEIIKLSVLCRKLKDKFDVVNLFTGQSPDLFNGVKELVPKVDYFFDLKKSSLCLSYSDLMKISGEVIERENPDLVIVQGDTSTAYACAMSAFMMGTKVGHVEAGLRTNNIYSPYPEEFNRQCIAKIANYNWCPSELAMQNLIQEKVSGKITLTGNTINDLILEKYDGYSYKKRKTIIVTLHRRENKNYFQTMISELNRAARENKDYDFILPCHPNPNIKNRLSGVEENNIYVVDPIPYVSFINIIGNCDGIITDSGGIQEEAIYFRKKTLICREQTERPEGIHLGLFKIVHERIADNFCFLRDKYVGEFTNPYGSGNASDLIIESLCNE